MFGTRAADSTLFIAISIALTLVLIILFCIWLMNMGLAGVWIGMACDEIFRGIIVFIRWQRGTWRGKRIVSSAA